MKTKILFTLLFVGCFTLGVQAQFNKKDLVGIWQINTTKMLKSMPEAKKKTTNANAELLGMMLLSGSIEFQKDGTSISIGPSFSGKPQTTKGKWTLNGSDLVVKQDDGKKRQMKLTALNKSSFVIENPKNKGESMEFMNLGPIMKAITKTNNAKATKDQLVGDWTLTAVSTKGRTFAFGVTYTMDKDGTQKLKTVLGQTDDKLNGTWKMAGKNAFEVKTPKETTTFKIVYFTTDRMVAVDNKGDKALFDRKK